MHFPALSLALATAVVVPTMATRQADPYTPTATTGPTATLAIYNRAISTSGPTATIPTATGLVTRDWQDNRDAAISRAGEAGARGRDKGRNGQRKGEEARQRGEAKAEENADTNSDYPAATITAAAQLSADANNESTDDYNALAQRDWQDNRDAALSRAREHSKNGSSRGSEGQRKGKEASKNSNAIAQRDWRDDVASARSSASFWKMYASSVASSARDTASSAAANQQNINNSGSTISTVATTTTIKDNSGSPQATIEWSYLTTVQPTSTTSQAASKTNAVTSQQQNHASGPEVEFSCILAAIVATIFGWL